MGHSSSKNAEESALKVRHLKTEYSSVQLPPTPLSSLQTAVLYKKHLRAEQLMKQTEDINGVGETGLSLLHLAVLPNPPVSFHSVKYYEYLWSSCVGRASKHSIERMIALLFERGAKLTPDNFKLNPLESLYYCSANSNQCLHLAKLLSKSVDITVDNIIRYSVWTLLHHKQHSKLTHGTKAIIECCKWGPKKEIFESMALFVKHGVRPCQYFSGITPKCNSIFECCHESKEILCVEEIIISFEYWEFKINIWVHLWDFNDPLSFAFNLHLLNIFENSFYYFFEKRTKLMIEQVISSWVKAPQYRYSHLSEGVGPSITLISKIVRQASNHSNKNEIIDKMISFTLLKRFLEMLTAVILTQKIKTHFVKQIISVSFEIYQLLIQIYGDDCEIPFIQTETFSTSLAKVIPLHLTTSISCTSPLSRFIALFNPDINARNAISGRTPIQEALLYGNIFFVQTLLEGGANPFTVDRDGNSFVDQLNSIISSLGMGPAREVYEETRDKYVMLNKPYPLLALAATTIVRNNIPFAILGRQPRLYNMILYYLPPT